jgi:hypothetical protein
MDDIMDWVSVDTLVFGILKVEDATGSGDDTLSGEFMKSNQRLFYAPEHFLFDRCATLLCICGIP